MAELYERRGFPVLEACGGFFVRLGRFSYTRVPPTEPLDAAPDALDDALRRARAASLQFPTRTHPGVERGAFVCRTAGYSLQSIRQETRRRQVRRGLEVTTIRQLDGDELFERGLELNLDTMKRHGRFEPEFGTKAGWRRFCRAHDGCRTVTAFAAFVDGRLSVWATACRDGRFLHLMHKMSLTADLKRYASIAFDYWTLAEAAKDPGIEVVTNGTLRPSLVEYKETIGFEIVPFRWALRLHPALRAVAASPWCSRATGLVARALPGNPYARSIATAVEGAQAQAWVAAP
jgi:hypothetical protein